MNSHADHAEQGELRFLGAVWTAVQLTHLRGCRHPPTECPLANHRLLRTSPINDDNDSYLTSLLQDLMSAEYVQKSFGDCPVPSSRHL